MMKDMDSKTLNIKEVTLLSVSEALLAEENVPGILASTGEDWWLHSPGINDGRAAIINNDGFVYSSGRNVSGSSGVRPVLRMDNPESNDLQIGDQFKIADCSWTMISDDMALCDNIVEHMQFNNRYEYGNDYEGSDISHFVAEWAKQHDLVNHKENDLTLVNPKDIESDKYKFFNVTVKEPGYGLDHEPVSTVYGRREADADDERAFRIIGINTKGEDAKIRVGDWVSSYVESFAEISPEEKALFDECQNLSSQLDEKIAAAPYKVHGYFFADDKLQPEIMTDEFPRYKILDEKVWEWDFDHDSVSSLDDCKRKMLEEHPDYYMGMGAAKQVPGGDFLMTPIPCAEYPDGVWRTLAERRAYAASEAKKLGVSLGAQEHDYATGAVLVKAEGNKRQQTTKDERKPVYINGISKKHFSAIKDKGDLLIARIGVDKAVSESGYISLYCKYEDRIESKSKRAYNLRFSGDHERKVNVVQNGKPQVVKMKVSEIAEHHHETLKNRQSAKMPLIDNSHEAEQEYGS